VQTKADVAPPKADAPQSDAPQAKADTAQPKADAAQPTADAAQPKSNPLRLKIDVERPKTEAGGADQTQILLTPTPAENSETRIIRTDAPARKPVFVDSTGRRGKRVRRVAYGLALAVLLAVAAVWVSQFDSWAKPPAPTTSGVTK
jgi:cytochrome c-type biogenesis protein CcmH/NrfG